MAKLDRITEALTKTAPTLNDIASALTRVNPAAYALGDRGASYGEALNAILAKQKKDAMNLYTVERQAASDDRAERGLTLQEAAGSRAQGEYDYGVSRRAGNEKEIDAERQRRANEENRRKQTFEMDKKLHPLKVQTARINAQAALARAQNVGQKKTALQEKIDTIANVVGDRETAIKVATGMLVWKMDAQGGGHLLDKANNKVIKSFAAPQAKNVDAVVNNPAVVPHNLSAAFGTSAFLSSIPNAMATLFEADPPLKAADKATRFMNVFKTDAALTLTQSYPGRISNFSRQQVLSMFPDPSSISTTPDQAFEKFMVLRERTAEELNNTARILNSGALTKSQRGQVVQARTALESLLKSFDQVMNNWGPAVKGQAFSANNLEYLADQLVKGDEAADRFARNKLSDAQKQEFNQILAKKLKGIANKK